MRQIVLTLALFIIAHGASAAIKVIESGQLIGADNVEVGGSLYNVRFVEGDCITVFDGCDSAVDDFTFTLVTDAVDPAQALLDQVFIDDVDGNHDTMPELTLGCGDLTSFCFALTPYFVSSSQTIIAVSFTRNFSNELLDGTEDNTSIPNLDTSLLSTQVFAKWTPVPLPAGVWLLLSGLTGLALNARRMRQA